MEKPYNVEIFLPVTGPEKIFSVEDLKIP